MIDKLLIRNNPEVVIESQKKRFGKVDIVEECIKLDKSWREGKLFF
jgi:seryl-tRNA synthetase